MVNLWRIYTKNRQRAFLPFCRYPYHLSANPKIWETGWNHCRNRRNYYCHCSRYCNHRSCCCKNRCRNHCNRNNPNLRRSRYCNRNRYCFRRKSSRRSHYSPYCSQASPKVLRCCYSCRYGCCSKEVRESTNNSYRISISFMLLRYSMQIPLHACKSIFFPFHGQHLQVMQELLSRIGMKRSVIRTLVVICQGACVRISFPFIYFAGGNAIDDHLHDIPIRHGHGRHSSRYGMHAVIDPVLVMVFIPALVMQPGGRIALRLPFRIVRAPVSLIILRTDAKFLRHIFRKIVRKPLPVKPHGKASLCHKPFVIGDCLKMSPDLTHFPLVLPLVFLLNHLQAARQRL